MADMKWECREVIEVHTETNDEIRIISLREANKNEQRLFFNNF